MINHKKVEEINELLFFFVKRKECFTQWCIKYQQVAATIQQTARYSFFTQTYKLPQTLAKDYQLLAECTERLSKIEMDQLIPKQFIEQDFNVQVKKTSQESQYEQLLNIMSDTFRQIKKT